MLKKPVIYVLLVTVFLLAACGPAVDDAAMAELQSQLEAAQAALEEAEAAGGEESGADLEALQAELDAAQAALEDAEAAAAAAAAAGEEEGAMGTYSVEFKNPDTITYLTIGEPESLDPAVTYESSGISTLRNLYDTLIFFKGSAVDEFVPMLAEDWEVSEDGMTYTFYIREGVTFHDGGTLEPHDVAYTFQRNLLLGWDFLEMGGPMGLYFDPFFNGLADYSEYGMGSVEDGIGVLAYAGDDVAACELIKETISADDEAGTVTMQLAYNAGYFPQLLAQPWAGIQDMEWMVEQGAWDGDCATWRDYYAPDTSASTLYDKANGTGPYKLDHWTAGEELVLVANEDWWVSEPLWEGSSVDGVPEVKTIVTGLVEEWGTRLASVQAGDADLFDAEIAFASQTDDMVAEWIEYGTGESTEHNPNGILRLYHGLPEASTADMFMNFNIDTEGGNPFLGSGELDGSGIPADFFSDIHVRRAFNYCFDRDTYIEEVRQGEAIPHRGPIIADMMGYNADSEIYDYDLAKCEEEFKLAWDGAVWETGFQLTLAYNSGNDSRRIANEVLRDNLSAVNPNFQVIIADMPWPAYLAERRAGRLPVHLTGWIEDFHHPHNWVLPYMSCHGDFSGAQNFPEEMCAPWDAMISEAVRMSGSDPAGAEAIYTELQAASIENAIDIFIHQPTGRHYEQLWIEGWYYHPMFDEPYYAALSKVAP